MTVTNTKKHAPFACVRTLVLASSIAILSACGGSGGSGVGDKKDQVLPVASATAIGLGNSTSTTNKTFSSRSNSQVVLSGKDSDSAVAPLLEFDWQQTAGPSVTLIERTANAVAFDTPDTPTDTSLTFQLTVTDANGRSDSDEVTVNVTAVTDANRFLADPRVAESILTVQAALEGGETTGSSEQLFTLEVVTVAHYRNQAGDMDELPVNTQIIDGVFPANFSPAVGYDSLNEPRNPLLEVELVLLDADDINQNYETSDRQRRLESYEIPTAYLEIQITITSAPAINFELFALNNQNAYSDGNDIEGSVNAPAEILTAVNKSLPNRSRIDMDKIDSPVNATAASNGAILQTSSGLMSTSLLTTNVLKELGLESHITANAYYNQIDPNGETTTFSAWAQQAGFKDAAGNDIDDPSIAHALYLNNYDLGFGRDMYLRKADDGNVYSYVTNYPTLEAGLEGRGEFAIVAMEYSENPNPNGANAKIVKFYVYSADKRSGDFIRVNSINFDGGGERFVPGVCTVCHQGFPGDRDYTDVADADLGATFMPWDLDSLLYTKANNAALVETTLNTAEFPAAKIDQFSRENQESELRKLNLGALATYVDNPDRHEASIQLIHGWYGDADLQLPVDELPDNNFDGSFVPAGWVGQEDLYQNVFSRTCRICHTQIDSAESPLLTFDSYEKFVNKKAIIANYVFEQGLMPIARLSFDRFWVDFDGSDSAANQLRAHLMNELDVAGVPAAPGLPGPRFSFAPTAANIDDTIGLNASASVFSVAYSWMLTNPAGSTSSLNNSSGVTSSFSADLPGGSYGVTLTTTNKNGATASFTDTIVIDNRAPVAQCLAANSSGMTAAGELSNIPVVSLITGLGDGGVVIDSAVNGNLGTVTIDANAQTLSYQLNNPFVRGVDTIEYQLVDFDGSLSSTANGCVSATAGFASITIDSSITGTGAPASASASAGAINNTTEIDISWTAPSIAPDSYNVYRNATATGEPLNSSPLSGFSFSDDNNGLGLTAGTGYNYSVEAIINGFASQPTTTSAATLSLTPTALIASNDGTATVDETQIGLNWTVPPAGSATVDNYIIYRDANVVDTSTTNSYSDSGLTPGTTYSYQVSANDGLQESPLSNTATQSTRPLAASALTLSAGDDARSDITLNWTAPGSGNFDAFAVYRDDQEIARVGVVNTSFADSGLSANTNYSYYVTTISANGTSLVKESAQSNSDNLTTAEAGANQATGLTASLNNPLDATAIDVTWTTPTAFTPEGYNLYRIDNGAPEASAMLIGTPADNSTPFTDSGLTNATRYQYLIEAIFDGEVQDRTGPTLLAEATTLSLQPTALIEGTVTDSLISFSWTSPTSANETITVDRSTDGGTTFPISVTPADCCTVVNDPVVSGTTYVYRVTGSQAADSAFATIPIASKPSDPGTLSVTSVTTSQIDLSWFAASGNVDSYNIVRSDDGFASSTTQSVTAPTVTLNSTGLSSGTDYEYRVFAVANGVQSDNFSAVAETTLPDAPTLSSPTSTTTTISLSWTASSGDIDEYRVYYSDDLTTPVLTTTAPTITTSDTGLVAATQYSYIVRAVAGGNESADSNTVTVSTVPEAPMVIAEDEADTLTTSLTVRWTPGTDGDATYQVFFGTNLVDTTNANETSATITGLVPATSYSVTVVATVNGLDSAASNPAVTYQTDVSFTDIQALDFSTNINCASCHGFTRTSHSRNTCITNNDNSLSDCPAPAFHIYTITDDERALVIEWRLDDPLP